MNSRLLLTCLALCLSHTVFSAPLNTSEKPGEEQAHRANSKSINLEDKGHDDDEGNRMKRVKEHKVNRKPSGRTLNLGGMGDLGGNNNDYKEDTRLEDRLAMEAEEEKKYETGEGYGTGGGGGGGAGWDDGGKGVNWATNIQRQDAAEKQSIQAQVASESAHELDEIQRAIAAESQSSRGSASIGNGGASVIGGAASPVQEQGGMQPRITNPEGGPRESQTMAFIGGQQKSISPSENQEISNLIHQADKMSPSDMRGAAQSSMGIGGLGAREPQGLGGAIGGLGGLEGAQQLGGQSQGTSLESASMAGSERLGGAMETGVSPGALGQTGLGESAGLSESAVSRMTDGSLGGRTEESPQGIQGMQSIQDIQGMQGMQSMSSALTGGQSQGGILSEGGGMSALQGQGMMGAGFQGGLQGMMGGGGGLAGLQSMGTGADLGQQQMSFKKRSKTHQKDEISSKHKKRKQDNRYANRKSALPRKHLPENRKTSPVKKSKLMKGYHSRETKTVKN